MKTSTIASAKFESIGKPDATLELHGETIRDITIGLAKWLSTVYMGSHLRITIARTPSELKLHTTRTKSGDAALVTADLMDEINSILDQPQLPDID